MQTYQKLLFLALTFIVLGCTKIKESLLEPDPLKLPPSTVGFDVWFPADELEEGINELLPGTLVDDVIKLNGKGDMLYLTVEREGQLDMAFRKGLSYASLPLKVKVAVKKKMLGITFSNRDVPIVFTGVLTTNASVNLDEQWNLELACNEMEMIWDEEPAINILGMDIDLTKTMENALEKNHEKILGKLCHSINQVVDFRQMLTKVWGDIQRPIRIAKKPDSLWLYTVPEALNAELMDLKDDTLGIHAEYKSYIYVTSDKNVAMTIQELPERGTPLSEKSAIIAYLNLKVPVSFLSEILQERVVGQSFEYEGYVASVASLSMSGRGQRLHVRLTLSGDFETDVLLSGRPELSDDYQFSVENFSYEVQSEDQVTVLADWLSHSLLEGYISRELSLDVSKHLGSLDSLANGGIAKSRVGSKISTSFDFTEIKSHQQRIANDSLEWIFYVEGSAGLTLKKDVLQKRKGNRHNP